jgi:hypothetical protein
MKRSKLHSDKNQAIGNLKSDVAVGGSPVDKGVVERKLRVELCNRSGSLRVAL